MKILASATQSVSPSPANSSPTATITSTACSPPLPATAPRSDCAEPAWTPAASATTCSRPRRVDPPSTVTDWTLWADKTIVF